MCISLSVHVHVCVCFERACACGIRSRNPCLLALPKSTELRFVESVGSRSQLSAWSPKLPRDDENMDESKEWKGRGQESWR